MEIVMKKLFLLTTVFLLVGFNATSNASGKFKSGRLSYYPNHGEDRTGVADRHDPITNGAYTAQDMELLQNKRKNNFLELFENNGAEEIRGALNNMRHLSLENLEEIHSKALSILERNPSLNRRQIKQIHELILRIDGSF
jgi:hypothetical protein